MLRTRILTAAVLGCMLLAGLFVLPTMWMVLGFGLVFAIGAWEWACFGALRGASRAAYAAVIAILEALAWVFTRDPVHLLWMMAAACAWWVAALLWLSLAPARHRSWLALACGVPVLVLSLVFLVISADIGAYFAGRRFGRHKLAPRVSPGKTWEGVAGGLALVGIVAWVWAASVGLPLLAFVAFGIAVGIFSVVGDLNESMFKRAAGLKDSGSLLPGHGGLLDRIDSVTAAAPLYALGLFGSGVIA
jgi:phosphatidate cytidylyltransferase